MYYVVCCRTLVAVKAQFRTEPVYRGGFTIPTTLPLPGRISRPLDGIYTDSGPGAKLCQLDFSLLNFLG